MTADELLDLPDDSQRHELVRGELRTMAPAGWEHGDWSSVIDGSLGPYARKLRLGRVFAGDVGFLLAADPDTVRAPDIAFVRRDRVVAVESRRGYFPGAPDLAVEVVSPNDRYTDVDEKVAEWLEHGTRMVLVVNPRRKSVAVHRPGQPTRTLTLDDAIDGEDVVPGWRLPLQELFADE